jgi:transposase-like protein
MGEVARFALTGMKRPRRRWTLGEKLEIVEAAKTSGDPVSVVARRHGMNANHLFNCLQRDREGTLDRAALYVDSGGPMDFIDLGVVGEAAAPARPEAMIEIDLPGGAKVRVGQQMDAAVLREVLLAVKAAS